MNESAYELGLIGFPLGHSYSAVLHRAAMAEFHLPGSYRLHPVQPTPEGEARLKDLLNGLREGRLRGLNVTIPWKQAVQPYLDHVTLLANEINAVNTLFVKDGRLTGDNTDGPGFLSDLIACFPNLSMDGSVLILGAGGSTYAVAHVLLKEGWSVHIAARRFKQAEALRNHFIQQIGTAVSIKTSPLNADALGHLSRKQEISLIVNCTPAGMAPDVQASPWPAKLPFPEGAVLYDLVYNPQETALVRQARLNGLRAVSGGGMLVEQAALSFERWFDKPAPREEMRKVFQLASRAANKEEMDRT